MVAFGLPNGPLAGRTIAQIFTMMGTDPCDVFLIPEYRRCGFHTDRPGQIRREQESAEACGSGSHWLSMENSIFADDFPEVRRIREELKAARLFQESLARSPHLNAYIGGGTASASQIASSNGTGERPIRIQLQHSRANHKEPTPAPTALWWRRGGIAANSEKRNCSSLPGWTVRLSSKVRR